MNNKSEKILNIFNKKANGFNFTEDLKVYGKLTRVKGLTLEAVGCYAPIGAQCLIETKAGEYAESEVVGFSGDFLQLMLKNQASSIAPGAKVIPIKNSLEIPVGMSLLGRVIDANAQVIDDGPPLSNLEHRSLQSSPINPLTRKIISESLDVGIRSINGLLSVGRGQRIGLMAGSGVGKSVLLGMMARYTNADIAVVGLIGERGREVKEFIVDHLGVDGLKRSVVVVAPADQSALMRLQGAYVTTAIAEYFRSQGYNVLMLMDSLTRFAQAQREISLSIGEPPTTKGYTPSVFAMLPQLVERAGSADNGVGSITGFYTVLAEGDDQNDPIVDAARAVLDGHIVLTRRLAEEGHYPAIDIEASISRVMTNIVDPEHLKAAMKFRKWYSKFHQNQDLIMVGAYVAGSDLELDKAVKYYPDMKNFLIQMVSEQYSHTDSIVQLKNLVAKIEHG